MKAVSNQRSAFSNLLAVNASLNFLSHNKRQQRLDERVVAEGRGLEEEFDESERYQQLEDAILALRPDFRILIVLRHFQNLSYDEMVFRNWSRVALFSSAIVTNIDSQTERQSALNVGGQIDFRPVLFSSLESTFSVGYAIAVELVENIYYVQSFPALGIVV